eukprot:5156080-Pleurochrysis_carterae.AAC.1
MSEPSESPLEHGKAAASLRPLVECCYAFVTRCDDEGISSESLGQCFLCGDAGLHHHFCALHNTFRAKASEPGGNGTSLCAKCSGQERNCTDVSDPTEVAKGIASSCDSRVLSSVPGSLDAGADDDMGDANDVRQNA